VHAVSVDGEEQRAYSGYRAGKLRRGRRSAIAIVTIATYGHFTRAIGLFYPRPQAHADLPASTITALASMWLSGKSKVAVQGVLG